MGTNFKTPLEAFNNYHRNNNTSSTINELFYIDVLVYCKLFVDEFQVRPIDLYRKKDRYYWFEVDPEKRLYRLISFNRITQLTPKRKFVTIHEYREYIIKKINQSRYFRGVRTKYTHRIFIPVSGINNEIQVRQYILEQLQQSSGTTTYISIYNKFYTINPPIDLYYRLNSLNPQEILLDGNLKKLPVDVFGEVLTKDYGNKLTQQQINSLASRMTYRKSITAYTNQPQCTFYQFSSDIIGYYKNRNIIKMIIANRLLSGEVAYETNFTFDYCFVNVSILLEKLGEFYDQSYFNITLRSNSLIDDNMYIKLFAFMNWKDNKKKILDNILNEGWFSDEEEIINDENEEDQYKDEQLLEEGGEYDEDDEDEEEQDNDFFIIDRSGFQSSSFSTDDKSMFIDRKIRKTNKSTIKEKITTTTTTTTSITKPTSSKTIDLLFLSSSSDEDQQKNEEINSVNFIPSNDKINLKRNIIELLSSSEEEEESDIKNNDNNSITSKEPPNKKVLFINKDNNNNTENNDQDDLSIKYIHRKK